MTDLTYTIHLTEEGKHFGDHAQDVTRALSVDPNMTVQELVNKALNDPASYLYSKDGEAAADPAKYLTIRAEVKL